MTASPVRNAYDLRAAKAKVVLAAVQTFAGQLGAVSAGTGVVNTTAGGPTPGVPATVNVGAYFRTIAEAITQATDSGVAAALQITAGAASLLTPEVPHMSLLDAPALPAGLIAGLIVASVAVIIIATIAGIVYRRRQKAAMGPSAPAVASGASFTGSSSSDEQPPASASVDVLRSVLPGQQSDEAVITAISHAQSTTTSRNLFVKHTTPEPHATLSSSDTTEFPLVRQSSINSPRRRLEPLSSVVHGSPALMEQRLKQAAEESHTIPVPAEEEGEEESGGGFVTTVHTGYDTDEAEVSKAASEHAVSVPADQQ